MGNKVYLNDGLVEMSRAAVAVANPSFLHGVGLFETLRTYDGQPFRLDQHIDRLRTSAQKLHIQVDDVIPHIPQAVQQVIKASHLVNARIRFTVSPPGPQEQEKDEARPTLLVAGKETAGYAPELYERGMTVHICDAYRQSRHDPLAGHKTTSYFPRLIALRDAQDRGCGEALWFTPDNLLAEGSVSNVFLVKAGRLRTPPLDTPVLPGITRAAVLELAHDNNLPVDEHPCHINHLLEADEVFLTNAIMEVMPVTRVEKRVIGNDRPGPITLRLAETYRELTRTQ